MSPHHLAKYTRNNDQLTRRVSRHDNRSSTIKPLSRRRKFIYYSTRLCVRIINSMTNFVTNAKFPTRRKMIKFPRKFKLSIRFTTMKRTKGEIRASSFASRWPTIFNSAKEGRVTRYGETNTATLTGNEITVLFAISYRASPRWLIQRAGIWSVKSFDSLHGPAVTFAPHSSLTLARLAAGETTCTLLPRFFQPPFVSPSHLPGFTRIRTSYATRPNFSALLHFF